MYTIGRFLGLTQLDHFASWVGNGRIDMENDIIKALAIPEESSMLFVIVVLWGEGAERNDAESE